MAMEARSLMRSTDLTHRPWPRKIVVKLVPRFFGDLISNLTDARAWLHPGVTGFRSDQAVGQRVVFYNHRMHGMTVLDGVCLPARRHPQSQQLSRPVPSVIQKAATHPGACRAASQFTEPTMDVPILDKQASLRPPSSIGLVRSCSGCAGHGAVQCKAVLNNCCVSVNLHR